MADDVLQFCISTSRRCLGTIKEWQTDGDAAVAAIKDALDAKFNGPWHVVAGKHYGSKVVHEARHFCMFYLKDLAVTIWR